MSSQSMLDPVEHGDIFDEVWDELADEGRCDARGGAEYTRVVGQWIEAGRPRGISIFILAHANEGPR